MKLKICSKCVKSLKLQNFGKDKYNSDGLKYKCKLCEKQHYLEKEPVRGVESEIVLRYKAQEAKKCICSIDTIMITGCKCGGV